MSNWSAIIVGIIVSALVGVALPDMKSIRRLAVTFLVSGAFILLYEIAFKVGALK